MPEGHTIHRAARLQRRRFAGRSLRVWSPQGRFAEGAAALDRGTIEDITARGKHLFSHWDDGMILHVHLGLFGRFRMGRAIEPGPNARLAWEHETDRLALSGPTVCELLDYQGMQAIVDRLGPDPLLNADGAEEHMRGLLARRSVPIGAALLDQRVLAGIGNVYRAEILFLAGIDPTTPAKSVTSDQVRHIWGLAVDLLARGERLGRIVTVSPTSVGVERDRDVPRGSRLFVYKRTGRPCRVCGTAIDHREIGGRNLWFCPSCQVTTASRR